MNIIYLTAYSGTLIATLTLGNLLIDQAHHIVDTNNAKLEHLDKVLKGEKMYDATLMIGGYHRELSSYKLEK